MVLDKTDAQKKYKLLISSFQELKTSSQYINDRMYLLCSISAVLFVAFWTSIILYALAHNTHSIYLDEAATGLIIVASILIAPIAYMIITIQFKIWNDLWAYIPKDEKLKIISLLIINDAILILYAGFGFINAWLMLWITKILNQVLNNTNIDWSPIKKIALKH